MVVTDERLVGDEVVRSDDDEAADFAIECGRGFWEGEEGCDATLSDEICFDTSCEAEVI